MSIIRSLQEEIMSHALIDLAYQLTHNEEAFVMATVVWCEKPSSAKPGAQGIIQANGQLTGWVGGSCTQDVIMREATRLLHEGGEPCLIRIGAPNKGPARTEVTQGEAASTLLQQSGLTSHEALPTFPMACSSGGTVDVYLEPHLPRPRLLLIGESPILIALGRLAETLDFTVLQHNDADLSRFSLNKHCWVLVATHGQYDEEALEQVLRSSARYIGMVGSQKRAAVVRDYLHTRGLTDQQIARLHAPAGLDIGATTPEEIAASILAEMIQIRHQSHASDDELRLYENTEPDNKNPEQYEEPEPFIDPVCGMSVEVAHAQHVFHFDGQAYYFCCAGCKRKFQANPQLYLTNAKATIQ
jgi:xanthine dehydrogenase accessory factor